MQSLANQAIVFTGLDAALFSDSERLVLEMDAVR